MTNRNRIRAAIKDPADRARLRTEGERLSSMSWDEVMAEAKPLTAKGRREHATAKRTKLGRPPKSAATKFKPTLLTLPPDVLALADDLAKQAGTSRSALVAKLITDRAKRRRAS
ncbi:MAG: hypothetical protein QM770_24945 [Tepidisphaeraceae bacterium]